MLSLKITEDTPIPPGAIHTPMTLYNFVHQGGDFLVDTATKDFFRDSTFAQFFFADMKKS